MKPSTLYSGSGNRFSDIHTKLTLFPGKIFFLAHEDYISPYTGTATTLRTSVGITQPQFNATAIHTYAPGAIDQLLWIFGGTYKDFTGRWDILYDLKDSSWIYTLYGITYHPSCWSITLSLIQTRRPPDTAIHFAFNLVGITTKAQPASSQ